MAQTGDWVTPRLWGKPWFEKPPLLYWTTAVAFKAGLDSGLAPRLPVALISVAFLIYFFVALGRQFGELAAFYATTILATSAGWLAYSHVAVTDLPMSAAFAAAMLTVIGDVDPSRSRRGYGGSIGAGILLGLAVLAKGLVPIALFIPAIWFLRGRIRELWVIFGVAAVVAAPWYVLVLWRNGAPFIDVFFVQQTFGRFASKALGHDQPFWFYLPILLAGLFPWTPFLALLFQKRVYADRRACFLLTWILWCLVFFSVFLNKLPGYLLPILPAAAALFGISIASATERSKKITFLIAVSAALLWFIPAIQELLPQALLSGISHAPIELPRGWILPLAVAILCALLEWTGRRTSALAFLGLVTALSVVRLVQVVYPILDERYSARGFWISHRGAITCVPKESRAQRYGLDYYAERDLPNCN